MNRILIAGTIALALTSAASAEVLKENNMPLNIAVELAQGAVSACAADGYNVSAAVVDRAGVVRALLRADNAGPHTVSAASQKAFTSASARTPTSVMVENIQKNQGAAQLVAIEGFLVLAGGVPVKIGKETIGAIGVGGAPGGQLDEACANAAIAKVKDQLK
ncbi:heme-binding protein [Pararhizobium sp. YC-54]|uniref:GlcG/HbpS family heme-binding protein n=1 Tax=Pararhizobium sp. YC-54 TaxID=2986920 RepID=UPI0021F74FD7|nr:heme-binding protein [Pararhizobium sp. YC-54]MCW0002095.1 heme-binding protein [Pararhizobium sp. YC-54]